MTYTPIKSVLYDLSLTLEPNLWNESTMEQHLLVAARKIGGLASLVQQQEYYQYDNYTLEIPDNLKHINQIIYYLPSDKASIEENAAALENIKRKTDSPHPEQFLSDLNTKTKNKWKVFYKHTGSTMQPCQSANSKACFFTYHQGVDCIQMSIKSGIVSFSYLGHAKSKDGEFYIADNETLKEALLNYCLFKYFDMKMKSEPNQINSNERTFHLQRYSVLAQRAKGEINMPDVATMENLKNQRNRLMPKSNRFESGFENLSKPESGLLF